MSIDPPKNLPAVPESLLPREHALYRPRHSSRQRTALTLAVLFFCAPAMLLLVGVRPAEFENRRLAGFPSITDGWGFFTGLNAWASDHVPLRDVAVAAADGISRGVFGEAPQLDRSQDVVGPVPEPKDPSVDRPTPTAFVEAIEGKDDWLFLGDDVEGACEPLIPITEVHARLARLRAAVEGSGRRFILVVAPNKSTMVPDYLPSKYFGKDCHAKATEEFWQSLSAKTGALDLRSRMRETAKLNNRLPYPKYDSHWTHDGSLVMARVLTDTITPGTSRGWKVEPTHVIDREGDLAPLLGRTATDPIQSYDLAPDGNTVRSHEITPDPKPQRFTQPPAKGVVNAKVGLLGDSFSYYAGQYLVACFTDLTLVHVDRLTNDARGVARALASTDVVVLEAAERLLVSGLDPVLEPPVIDVIAEELAKQPR
ncbi:MAG: hypothetical protein HOV94_14035 [Saccharothrix sp.]|nr:hypothetical protein [Saccharothrix sp.]